MASFNCEVKLKWAGRNYRNGGLEVGKPSSRLLGTVRAVPSSDSSPCLNSATRTRRGSILLSTVAMDAAAVAAIVMVKLLFVVKALLALSAAIALEKVLHIVRHAVRFERRTRSGHSISAVVAPLGS